MTRIPPEIIAALAPFDPQQSRTDPQYGISIVCRGQQFHITVDPGFTVPPPGWKTHAQREAEAAHATDGATTKETTRG